ncbi:cobyrinic acid a,c-diamide synthase [Lachnospiraceae bacterium RM5]|nr:cobyrinic acid a,c-diamide synthase [Lachnospiraceae bacterium RM5]
MSDKNSAYKIPRVLIGAPKSGSGKTLITCALLLALKKRNIDVMSFKCGPDYIDPMFHRSIQGIPAENLDTFFLEEKKLNNVFVDCMSEHKMAVMEGVMGLYDGLGGVRKEGSSYHLAQVTKTPVILVVDVHGMGKSMIPLIKGFIDYDNDNLIRGIILNRISSYYYDIVSREIKKEIKVPLLGYFPTDKNLSFESRHLGLIMPEEVKDINDKLNAAAMQLEKTVNIDKLLEIASQTEDLEQIALQSESKTQNTKLNYFADSAKISNSKNNETLTIAVARDEAFCFYYEANIREFEKKGIKIKYFSPLRDKEIPKDVDGLLLGGGYPELYAKELSENISMMKSIKLYIENGMPSLAECGGFMYLHDSIICEDGHEYKMMGVINGKVSFRAKLVRFGYIELEEKKPTFLGNKTKIKAHEFHYFDSDNNGESCIAIKPVSEKKWQCILEGDNYFWGFPHLYYPSAPEFVEHFVERMILYKKQADRN